MSFDASLQDERKPAKPWLKLLLKRNEDSEMKDKERNRFDRARTK